MLIIKWQYRDLQGHTQARANHWLSKDTMVEKQQQITI